MRVALVLMLLAPACTDGVAPPELVAPDQGVPDEGEADLATEVEDLLPPLPDLVPPADLTDRDALVMSCMTACDCTPGQRCNNGACEVSNPAVFCCGTAACTGSNVCETMDKKVSQCGANPDAGIRPDAGTASCTSVACIPGLGSAAFCTVVCGRTATCMGPGGNAHCAP
jgi:hypothetical protein